MVLGCLFRVDSSYHERIRKFSSRESPDPTANSRQPFFVAVVVLFFNLFYRGVLFAFVLGGGAEFLWRPIALVILFISHRDGGRVHLLVEWGPYQYSYGDL